MNEEHLLAAQDDYPSPTRRWEEHGETYQKVLDELESELIGIVRDYHISNPIITREHSDFPEVTVTWQSDDTVTHSVHLGVTIPAENAFVHAGVSAYQDDLEQMTRRWVSRRMGASVYGEGDEVYHMILDVMQRALEYTSDDLIYTVKLPSLPPGLSAEQEKQIIRSAQSRLKF
jgi:hypothetical protein